MSTQNCSKCTSTYHFAKPNTLMVLATIQWKRRDTWVASHNFIGLLSVIRLLSVVIIMIIAKAAEKDIVLFLGWSGGSGDILWQGSHQLFFHFKKRHFNSVKGCWQSVLHIFGLWTILSRYVLIRRGVHLSLASQLWPFCLGWPRKESRLMMDPGFLIPLLLAALEVSAIPPPLISTVQTEDLDQG